MKGLKRSRHEPHVVTGESLRCEKQSRDGLEKEKDKLADCYKAVVRDDERIALERRM